MLDEHKFSDLLCLLDKMDREQLEELACAANDQITIRRQRFYNLCLELEQALTALQDEYPRANVYLTIGANGKVNLMDCIIPMDFTEKCEIGD